MKLTPGTIVDDRYKILSIIGSGGMGTVFQAQHLMLDRLVALKLLDTEGLDEDPEMLPRFEREAMATNALKHRNIVMFYGYGVWQQAPYMVMECVQGTSLERLLQNSAALSVDRTLDLISQILEGLQCAHENGIVHRDLKPSNIIVSKDSNGKDLAKLIDFGLAKVLPKFGVRMQKLTEAGSAVGSVLYMSPEQCMGKEADARSDIYGVGCILFHCLAGEPPFDGEHSVVVMHKQIKDAIPQLSKVRTDKTFPDGMQAIIRKALAKHPNDRYTSAAAMAADIAAIRFGRQANLTDDEEQRKIDSAILHVVPTSRSKPLIFMLLGATVSLIGITVFALQNQAPPKQQLASVDYYAQARASGGDLMRAEAYEKAIATRGDGRLGAWRYFDSCVKLAQLYLDLNEPQKAEQITRDAINSPDIELADGSQQTELIIEQAHAVYTRDRWRALAILQQRHAKRPDSGAIARALANVLQSLGRIDEADELRARYSRPADFDEKFKVHKKRNPGQ